MIDGVDSGVEDGGFLGDDVLWGMCVNCEKSLC